jgi:multiple sugar transport system ATP-binding protein
MATRIVIMKDGIIQQVGAPKTVYNHPANMFVAGFIGSPSMNFVRGTIDKGSFVTETLKLAIPADIYSSLNLENYQHKPVILGIRPEDILPVSQDQGIEAYITVAELTGAEFMLYVTVGGHELTLRANSDVDYRATQNIKIAFDMNKSHFFDAETEVTIN